MEGLLHDSVTSDVACVMGELEWMLLCQSPTRESSAMTLFGSPEDVMPV